MQTLSPRLNITDASDFGKRNSLQIAGNFGISGYLPAKESSITSLANPGNQERPISLFVTGGDVAGDSCPMVGLNHINCHVEYGHQDAVTAAPIPLHALTIRFLRQANDPAQRDQYSWLPPMPASH
jgi:hypothetical protein